MPARKKGPSPIAALREYALGFPGAVEEFPWGECVVKVKGKIFVFLGTPTDGGPMGLSVKLPSSAGAALDLPFTKPTGYGLGKAGWISARFEPRDDVPVPLLMAWIEESYRAIAPKTLLSELDSTGVEGSAVRGAEARKSSPRKARAASSPRATKTPSASASAGKQTAAAPEKKPAVRRPPRTSSASKR